MSNKRYALIKRADAEWEAGCEAGRRWLHEEAERGVIHRFQRRPDREGLIRILIEHPRQIFGGQLQGRSKIFIRGFVRGATEGLDQPTAPNDP